MKKILIAYYSRTGTTRELAMKLQEKLGADREEIETTKDRSGVVGYFICGKEATKKQAAEIKPTGKTASEYDLIVLGTPVWGWNISSPLRAYLEQNRRKFKAIAAFCTMSGSGDKRSFSEIESICGLKLLAQASFLTKDVKEGKHRGQLEEFLKSIQAE